MSVRIVCVTKPSGNLANSHEAIEEYGWVNEKTGKSDITKRVKMVEFLKGGGQAYVTNRQGIRAYCEVRTNQYGTEFLQTVTDGIYTDNLLSLDSCPVSQRQ
ncbi:MAG TPA: DUF3892 domain-containing protein [Patescibacteria group bacterium]